jgi:hypothetical protein
MKIIYKIIVFIYGFIGILPDNRAIGSIYRRIGSLPLEHDSILNRCVFNSNYPKSFKNGILSLYYIELIHVVQVIPSSTQNSRKLNPYF